MTVPYDVFTGAFLSKITEYDLVALDDNIRTSIVDGYMKRVLADSLFKKACNIDFHGCGDDELREFEIDIDEEVLDDIVEIVADGMLVQWMKPYVYKQENLEMILTTRDYTMYSPAELTLRVGNAYTKAQRDYTQHIREYSYNHGDLTSLHI